MLNVGFSELLLTGGIALVAIGPKELPGALRQLVKLWREIQAIGEGVKRQMQEVVREVEMHGNAPTTIIDMDGNPQPAYDVKDLESLRNPPVPAPPIVPTKDKDAE